MNRDDKLALIALALLLVAVIALAALEIGYRYALPDPPAYGESGRMDGEQEGPNPDGHILGDSIAQWVMALFTVMATVISGVAVKLVNDTLNTSRRATEAAIRAVEVTQEIGERQLRPYIVHENATVRAVRSQGDQSAYLEVSVKIRNCGVSPGIINAVSVAVYAPSGGGPWGRKGGSWRATRMVLGPNQPDTLIFKGIDADKDGTFPWFQIGVLVWYGALNGATYEDHVWLTFEGKSAVQGYPDMGFALYRPEHDERVNG